MGSLTLSQSPAQGQVSTGRLTDRPDVVGCGPLRWGIDAGRQLIGIHDDRRVPDLGGSGTGKHHEQSCQQQQDRDVFDSVHIQPVFFPGARPPHL